MFVLLSWVASWLVCLSMFCYWLLLAMVIPVGLRVVNVCLFVVLMGLCLLFWFSYLDGIFV